ncbi:MULTISPECIES: DUF6502 family protein [unclassified Roseovarius]|uniref:DUF6502 family protein n=1 Tax=unclassified Roseovarius TaxID=2614913 RepID=UPI00273FC196|nr:MULTISPECIES: DUF6502 family protein [unclassified Roseovarius]
MSDFLDTLLAPLARLMIARGVLFSELSERLKAHYVVEAMRLSEGKATDSRLSVMTGLQRRDVARLRGFEPKPTKTGHLTRLVALWQTEDGYHDDGDPRDLARSGDAPSFDALARLVRRDVHPRTMLDALAETGTIELADDGQTVRLLSRSYQPHAGSAEQVAYLAQNVGDHLSAATGNVTGMDPVFERAVHYGGLSEDQVKMLEDRHAALQMAVLQELNALAATFEKTSDRPQRFRAGAYFYKTGETDA